MDLTNQDCRVGKLNLLARKLTNSLLFSRQVRNFLFRIIKECVTYVFDEQVDYVGDLFGMLEEKI